MNPWMLALALIAVWLSMVFVVWCLIVANPDDDWGGRHGN